MLDYNDHYSNSDHSSPYSREATHNEVITDYAKAIELNPDYQNTYQHGWSYVRIGEYDRAIVDFTRLVKVYSGVPGGYYSRGWAYAEKGEYDRAIADFTRDIELGDIYCHFARGLAYAKIGNKSEAIADFDVIVRLSGDPELIPKAKQEIESLQT